MVTKPFFVAKLQNFDPLTGGEFYVLSTLDSRVLSG